MQITMDYDEYRKKIENVSLIAAKARHEGMMLGYENVFEAIDWTDEDKPDLNEKHYEELKEIYLEWTCGREQEDE